MSFEYNRGKNREFPIVTPVELVYSLQQNIFLINFTALGLFEVFSYFA